MDKYIKVPAYTTGQTSLVVSTSAYDASDVVGGLLKFDIPGVVGGGIINACLLTDDANQSEPFHLYLFDAAPTSIDDAAAFAPAIADLKKIVARISIAAADYVTVNSNGYALKSDLNEVFDCSGGTGQLFGYLVANGSTPDYAATTDLYVALRILTEQ